MEQKQNKMAKKNLAAYCHIPLFIFLTLFLSGCIHSAVTREAECQMDRGVVNMQNQCSGYTNADPLSALQKTNNMSKGVVLGGAAGALGLTSSVGLLPGTAIGAILGGAFGAYLDYYSSTIDQLKNRGVKVYCLGDQVKFVIPSNQLFYCNSPQILTDAECTLDMIIRVINGMPNITVQIGAYTHDTWPACIALALTKQQANSVARYMWRKCLNTRLLTANGYGGTHLVDVNCMDWNVGDNYRVEISLERLPT